MKKTLFVLCLLSSTAAFAQYYGGSGAVLNNQPIIFEPPSHPAHANYTAMTPEQSVLSSASYNLAEGYRPASDFPQPEAIPLGTTARELRKQHYEVKKSHVVWINQ